MDQPRLVKIDLGNGDRINKDFKELQEVFDDLAALPLLKLQSLTVSCSHVMPLVQSNWPMLTELKLTIHEEDHFFGFSYPSDLQFPQCILKKLELKGDLDIWLNSENGEEGASKVAFLGPFLKSCPDLTYLGVSSDDYCSEEMATMIVAAPLERLERLEDMGDSLSTFSPVFFFTVCSIVEAVKL